MSQEGKTSDRGALPLVNQYFTQTSDCHSNFFDDISSTTDSSAFMRSVVSSSSSSDLFQAASVSDTLNTNVSTSAEKYEDSVSVVGKANDNRPSGKEEPVVCRIFSSRENITKPSESGSGRDFFDMIGSHSVGGSAAGKSTPSLSVDFNLGVNSGPTSLIQTADFNPGSKYVYTVSALYYTVYYLCFFDSSPFLIIIYIQKMSNKVLSTL